MEAYPRKTIWPYALLILLLFSLTAAIPRMWRASEVARGEQFRATVRRQQENRPQPTGAEDRPLALISRVTDVPLEDSSPRSVGSRTAQRVIVEPSDLEVSAEQPSPSAASPESVSSRRPMTPSLTRPTNHVRSRLAIQPARGGEPSATPAVVDREQDEPLDWLGLEVDELAAELPEEPSDGAEQEAISAAGARCWPRPSSLLALLDAVPRTDQSALNAWIRSTRESLDRLTQVESVDHPQAVVELSRLQELAARIPALETGLDRDAQILLRRIGYGLERRLAIWQSVHQFASATTPVSITESTDPLTVLAAARRHLARSDQTASSWEDYLLLDRLNELASASWLTDSEVRRTTARDVLDRMTSADLTAEQRGYLEAPPMAELASTLKRWAYEPFDPSTLINILEQFETSRSGKLAADVVATREGLRWHPSPEAQKVLQNLDTHYRNANIRLAISGELINDLLPVLQPIQEQVRDNILGAEVLGQNKTWTNLRVSLIDDDRCIRLRFEADGQTRSQTVSIVGPVRLYNRSQGQFQAGKDLMITRDGIFVQRATAAAEGQAKLLNVETDYDHIPLLGWILRQVALDEVEEQRPVVRREVRQRISQSASRRLDASVHEHLTGAEQTVDRKVLEPLRHLQLDPQALEMRTTADHIVLRSRIASPTQLAGYTPRPRAQQDSLLSLQIHESAANNLLQQLNLEGRRIDMEELMLCLSEKLHIDRTDIHEELPENARVRLGYDRPIEVEFDNDLVLLTVRIAELSTGKRTWHNFVVRGRYRADVTRLSVDLSREGGIELISDEIGFRDQIALRGIFTKVMTRNHRLNLMRDRFVEDRRLASLVVNQFVVRDGWIGVSVGLNSRDKVAAEQAPQTR